MNMIKHMDALGKVCPFPVVEAEAEMELLSRGSTSEAVSKCQPSSDNRSYGTFNTLSKLPKSIFSSPCRRSFSIMPATHLPAVIVRSYLS